MTLRRAHVAPNPQLTQTYRAQKLIGHSSASKERPALVTIQQNTRRNKPRPGVVPDDEAPANKISAGSKRKRPPGGIENAAAGPSNPRSAKRLKRSASPAQSNSDSDTAAMDTEESSETDEEETLDYYLFDAPLSELKKLRKDELVAFYKEANIARPASEVEQLTRLHLANAIIAARSNRHRRGVSKRAPNGKQPRPGRTLGIGRPPFTPDSDDYRTNRSNQTRTNLRRAATDGDAGSKTGQPIGRSFSLNMLVKPNNGRDRRARIDSHCSSRSDDVPPITPISPPITRKRVQSDPRHVHLEHDDSDVELPRTYEPSPRRLRSHGERSSQDSSRAGRKLPGRSVKPKIGELQEEDSDGFDSEGSAMDAVPASSTVDTDRDEDSENDDEDEEDEDRLSPRKLRNGKVITVEEEEEANSDSETEDPNASGDTEYMEEDEEDAESESIGGDNDADEDYDDDVDLSEETIKSLIRYRREELVRLCESRNLDVDGTKPQLAKALLEWRDSQQPSSSASTVRAPSTEHPKKQRHRPPVLERSGRVHVSQPRTPPLSEDHGIESVQGVEIHGTAEEPELEFDLGSLGLEDKEIPYEKLVKKEKIGSGGFKDVYSGLLGNRKVAIAEFRGTLTAMDIKELQLLRDLSHDNIVRFYGVSVPENTKETPVMMISELCANGDLFDYVRNEKAPSFSRVLRLMFDIASGLEYLHKHKPSIIHRDCKSSNILITRNGRAKIADFGLAKVKQSTRSMVRSLVGTVNWQAPELWNAHPKYDHKVDVFSCAMVFWEILQWHLPNKKYPWEGMNEHAIYDAVGAKRQRPSVSGLRKQWSPEIVDLIERMWAQDPRDRPSMSEVVEELDNMRA
ncbi:SubName: Full=Uncharacterized protein {ECO:0000313/EMBL:CCA68469.1} [Serendipita indica DSM 11827]|nr:SubName: Full=Uncharacterized protein {ECO:0000313/EMBL:CCA68469.1} [Serendipita indica DSM 11827]